MRRAAVLWAVPLVVGLAAPLALLGRGRASWTGFAAARARVDDGDIASGEGWVALLSRPPGRVNGREVTVLIGLPSAPRAGAVDLAEADVDYREQRQGTTYRSRVATGTLRVVGTEGSDVRVHVRATVSAPEVGDGTRDLDVEVVLRPYPGHAP